MVIYTNTIINRRDSPAHCRPGGTGPVGPVLAGPNFLQCFYNRRFVLGFLRISPNIPATSSPPPPSFVFPKRSFGSKKIVQRSCQRTWLEQWPWLYYSEGKDALFCSICINALKLIKLNNVLQHIFKNEIMTCILFYIKAITV